MTASEAEALDSVLEFLITRKTIGRKEMEASFNTKGFEFGLLIETVHAAGHIAYPVDIINITNTGFSFIKNGGYTRQYKIDQNSHRAVELAIEADLKIDIGNRWAKKNFIVGTISGIIILLTLLLMLLDMCRNPVKGNSENYNYPNKGCNINPISSSEYFFC